MKHFKVTVSLGLLCCLLFGCASKDRNEKINLRFSHFAEDIEPFKEVIKEFEKRNPEIRVRVEEIPGATILEKIKIEISSGDAPDVFVWDDEPYLALVVRGALLCLDQYIKRDKYDLHDFFEPAVEICKYKGKMYGIPMDGTAEVIFYNKTLFDKRKVPYPDRDWDWEKFVDTAKRLTRDMDGDGKIDQWGYLTNYGWFPEWLPWIWGAGGSVLDETKSYCVIDSPEAISGLKFYSGLALVHQVSPRVVEAKVAGMSPAQAFQTGRVAMHGAVPQVLRQFRDAKGFRWDVCLYPKGPKGRVSRYTSCPYVIFSGTKHPEEAWKLVKFLASPEIERKLVKKFKFPVRKSVAYSDAFIRTDTEWDEKVFAEAAEESMMQPLIPEYDEMRSIIQQIVDRVIVSDLTVEEAAREIKTKVDILLKK